MADEGCEGCTSGAPCLSNGIEVPGTTVVIDDCVVNFPFAPYSVQKEYMSKIIHALDKGGVAALESPTGTGKTMSLLCSTLAWVERYEKLPPSENSDSDGPQDEPKKEFSQKVVYYASRTHSQLSKAMAELRRTQYKNLNAAILGSRDQMCIHPDRPVAESLSIKNAFCRSKCLGKEVPQPLNNSDKHLIESSSDQQSLEAVHKNSWKKERKKVGRFPEDSDPKSLEVDNENRLEKERKKAAMFIDTSDDEESPENRLKKERKRGAMFIDTSEDEESLESRSKKEQKNVGRFPDESRRESRGYTNSVKNEIEKIEKCSFFWGTETVKKDASSFYQVRDIEDLVAKSEESGCCPFYLSRYLQEGADIVFLPYNYIFNRSISRNLNLKLDGGIVILDEAHNIDKVCEDAASVSLSSADIVLALRDISQEIERIAEESSDSDDGYYQPRRNRAGKDGVKRTYNTEDLIFMDERLRALELAFDDFMKTVREDSREFQPEALQVILNKAIITEGNYVRLEENLNALQDVVELFSILKISRKRRRQRQPRTHACTLRRVAEFIAAPYRNEVFSPQNLDSFVVHSELEYPVSKRNRFGRPVSFNKDKPNGITIHVWCLNPALGMRALWAAHSVILTSGTLSPLKNVILELGLEQFPSCVDGVDVERGEFSHVVPSDQFMIFSISRGPNGTLLQYDFKNKDNVDYWEELGQTISNFIRLIPDGVLVFFPSYQALDKASHCWRSRGLWDRLCAIKPLFAEVTDKLQFKNAIDGYKTSVDEGKGGIMMGICRGKMSEGIDFKDNYGRAVIVCGLPYPPLHDPKVKYKKRYIDSLKLSDLKGQDWYRAEATKAINQAIGRVIRHANDVGCIILCDTKFQQPQIASSVSAWLRPVSSMKNFGMAIATLRTFFRRHSNLAVKSSPSKGGCTDVEMASVTTNGHMPNFTTNDVEEVKLKEFTPQQDSNCLMKRIEAKMDSLDNRINSIERKIDRNHKLILNKLTRLQQSKR